MGSLSFFGSCKKEILPPEPQRIIAESCLIQISNPGGRSYPSDSVISFNCTSSFCSLMPLNPKNYWIYEDSVFNNGDFVKVKYDTLRFNKTWKSLSDGLVWWEPTISIGLPERV